MKKMDHYKFFQNLECEYFPCHIGADSECFNCLFCYCPLYALGDRCGGSFTYLENGVKDCSACLKPHGKGCYEEILSRMPEVMNLVKKP